MLVIDKVIQITNGNYHYKAKDIESLLQTEMRRVHEWRWKGEPCYNIETSVLINWRGLEVYKVLELTLTKTGKNKGSWRIVSTIRDMEDAVSENENK